MVLILLSAANWRSRPEALANSAKTWRKLGGDSMVYGLRYLRCWPAPGDEKHMACNASLL